jgi:putative membrane protein
VTDEPRVRSPRRRLEDVGEAPDARFSFANERTYLAWNRTALGCVVAGLAVLNVLTPDEEGIGPEIVGIALMVLGLLLAGLSYVNWYAAEKALRLRRPVPHSPMLMVLAVVTGAVAVVAAISSLT